MGEATDLRGRLRGVPVFRGELPRFDTDAAPDEPIALFRQWLDLALEAGVSQPHAMTLATSSADGVPTARTLLLKDVTDDGFWFSSLAQSPKGADVADNPRAALVLYWREQGRQVRVTGSVHTGSRELAERDFRERGRRARAIALASRQSQELVDPDPAIAEAQRALDADPDLVPDDWTAYRVYPETVEFWQAERERDQVRLLYRRYGLGWVAERLWP